MIIEEGDSIVAEDLIIKLELKNFRMNSTTQMRDTILEQLWHNIAWPIIISMNSLVPRPLLGGRRGLGTRLKHELNHLLC